MKNVVTIGGGTGTFVVLTGLRCHKNVALSAIVTEADDGGSTGHLRDAYGFLPPGDARQALVALAEDGNVLRDLFAYRFTKGDMKGHNLGNLFLTALTDLLGSDTKALEEASRILRVCGTVIPASEQPATLKAIYADGVERIGEHVISEPDVTRARITVLSLTEPLPLTPSAREAIEHADLIILGPGSLYSSTIAALLPDGMKEALRASKARLVYVSNLFTKAGQTDGFSVQDHVREVERYAGRKIDDLFIHEGAFPDDVLALYKKEGEYPITDDAESGTLVHRLSLASIQTIVPTENDPLRRSFIRHDSHKLAHAILSILP